MSTALLEIGYDLIDGIFDVLDGNVTYDGTTYPVYKSIPKPSASIYAYVHNVLHIEEGTKDDFLYRGSVQVEVVDESNKRQADKKLAQKILGVVRGLLKTSKSSTFTIGANVSLAVFSFGTYNELMDFADNGIIRVRLIDTYDFIIQ